MYRLLIKKINQTAKHQQHKRHGLLRCDSQRRVFDVNRLREEGVHRRLTWQSTNDDVDCFLYRNCPLIGYFASLHSQNPSMSLVKLQVFASHVRLAKTGGDDVDCHAPLAKTTKTKVLVVDGQLRW